MPGYGKVIVSERYRAYGEELERAVEKGLGRGAGVILAATKGAMTRTGPSGRGVTPDSHVRDTLRVSPVYTNERGRREISIYSVDPNALWQTRGTRAKRGRAKSTRAKAVTGGRGVRPLRFFERGLRSGFPRVLAEIKRAAP